MKSGIGKISQIIGPVIDVTFKEADELPNIYESLIVKRPDGTDLVLECQQQTGEATIRAIAMDSTDGLMRGLNVIKTGKTYQYARGRKH